MNISKASLATDGNKVCLTMPLSKVDKENRTVSGWASLDNLDSQKDLVKADATRAAFGAFRGNIREMHQNIAVGRMLNFTEQVYFDEKTEKFYNGIVVEVYVSKGSPTTWEKVLDGTLTGFSIGGNILKSEDVFDKAAGSAVRVVTEYELVELSLVDSPANKLANVISVHKTADGIFIDGMMAKSKSESVFYCQADGLAKTSNDYSVDCPEGHKMENIGWIEYDEDASKAGKVAEVIQKNKSSHEISKQVLPATNEGGVDVAEENKEIVAGETVPDDVAPAAEGAAETEVASSVEETGHVHAEGEEKVEKAADVSEVEVEEPDFSKLFGELHGALETGLTKTREEVSAQIAGVTSTFEAQVSELSKKNEELSTKFDGLTEQLAGVSKALETVDGKTAIKKSNDLGGSEETIVEKSAGSSKWGGTFVPPGGKRFLSVSELDK